MRRASRWTPRDSPDGDVIRTYFDRSDDHQEFLSTNVETIAVEPSIKPEPGT